MTVYMPSPAAATADGYTVTGLVDATVQPARAIAGGYGVLVHGAPPPAGVAPDALRLEVVDKNGNQLVNDLATRRNLTFTVEHNGSGSVTFETDQDALPAGVEFDPDNPSNLVRVHFGNLPGWPYGVAEGVAMSAPPTRDDTGRWVVTVSAPGSYDVLDLGALWPPDGATGDTREFSYTAGQTGPAWVPEEWGKPNGVLVRDSFRWKHRWPRGWPEKKARWLWSRSPEKPSGAGIVASALEATVGESNKFVGDSFTLTAKKAVRFYTAGDDTLKLYLNGARIKTKGRGAWKRTASFVRVLKAGTYTLAAEVRNLPGGDSRSGFIFAAAQLKADGSREKWLLRSEPSTFQVRTAGGYFAQAPLPPDGWYPAAVLHTHVGEAAARGVDFHSQITRTFTVDADSSGAAWTTKGQSEYEIEMTGTQLGDAVRSSGVDVAMLPGLRLSAWRSRGFDLRDRVVLAGPVTPGWSSRSWSRVRTVALTRHESGWRETAGDAGLSATYGRRELGVSGGGTDGDLQADALAAQALTAAGTPEETFEVEISSADMVVDPDTGKAGAPMPFRDFNVADVVTFETMGRLTPGKVMSITGVEQDDKSIKFKIAGYPV